MFGTLVRGAALLVVVGWYSTSMWRLIDGYFKDQFQRYLNEEYARNPRMRDDFMAELGKPESQLTDPPRPIGETDPAPENESVPAGVAGNEAATFQQPHVDEQLPLLPDQPIRNAKQEEQLISAEEEPAARQAEIPAEPGPEQQRAAAKRKKQAEPKKTRTSKKRRVGGLPPIGAKTERAAKKSRKKFQITLTDEDFRSAGRRSRYRDDRGAEGVGGKGDFSEFDDDDEEDERSRDVDADEPGILVSDLPFKPAVNIYDLERLPGEEFCPLTLDDDPSCEETRTWP